VAIAVILGGCGNISMDIFRLSAVESDMQLDHNIRMLDLECIAYKVCRDELWDVNRVDRVELEYRAFLQILKESGTHGLIAPTNEVDIFWHHHILDTEKYINDCQKIFGYYLHHYPYSGFFGETDSKQQLKRVNSTKEKIASIVYERNSK
jgi:hypothetical protein